MDTQDEQTDQLAALVEAALPDPEPTGPDPPPDDADFIVTKEHRRFTEFAAAVRRDRYIGLCYGRPGVGKTLSARRYACWHELEPLLRAPARHFTEGRDRADWHTLLYTPTVSATPRMIDKELTQLAAAFATIRTPDPFDRRTYASTHALPPFVELLIIDEADRLKTTALEQFRDHYDRSRLGMILIGMPGIEKRLARYPQLYSRIGFVHEYRPLSAGELVFVLQHHWSKLSLTLSADDFTDAEALAAVARITGGNFRLVQRLFAQIQRIMEINNLSTITREVVETARESLVIGSL
ncbi:MAG: AAA family ATPase [Trebonia sp.]|uniref:AAA family ATPase n=1 Tax=Trebonia sp. TaxID=2767075 RepID=UPI003BBEC6AF